MSNTPTNHRAWRLLYWFFFGSFGSSLLWAIATLQSKVGREDWTNWAWWLISVYLVVEYWERLFGKRPS